MQEHEECISKEVDIDYRVHAKLFGLRGKVIAKVSNYFNVVVHFLLDEKSNKITIAGIRKSVEYAIKHLLMLADYFMVDVLEFRSSGSRTCRFMLPNLGY